MVFPPVPVYLDHSTWLQEQIQQEAGHGVQLPLTIVPPPSISVRDGGRMAIKPCSSTVPPQPVGGVGTMSIRPCSMSERARLTKLAPPEANIKCPRCESTNTKFCYFNNYSLSQPRHFCKTCRRYWTRGGALRNVPVGGGSRRSKKSKGTKSKSPTIPIACSAENSNLVTNKFLANSSLNSQLPFFQSHHNVTEFEFEQMRLNFSGMQNSAGEIGDQLMRSYDQIHQFSWRSAQPTEGGFRYQGEAINLANNYIGGTIRDDQDASRTGLEAGLSSMKHKEDYQGSNLLKYAPSFHGNDQYWSGHNWGDVPGAASSASHFM